MCVFQNVPWLVSKLQPSVFTRGPHTRKDFGNMLISVGSTRGATRRRPENCLGGTSLGEVLLFYFWIPEYKLLFRAKCPDTVPVGRDKMCITHCS